MLLRITNVDTATDDGDGDLACGERARVRDSVNAYRHTGNDGRTGSCEVIRYCERIFLSVFRKSASSDHGNGEKT